MFLNHSVNMVYTALLKAEVNLSLKQLLFHNQFCSPCLDTIQCLNAFLVMRCPKLKAGFEVQPHEYRVLITILVLWAKAFLI